MSNALVIKDHPNQSERISKRLRRALDMMVWPGESGHSLEWYEAAHAAGILKESMRRSLRRPVVRMYLRTEQEVFRASLSSRIPARLGQLAFQNQNANAAVSACRAVLGQDEQVRSISGEARPWVTIRVIAAPTAPAPVTIEAKPIEPELGSDPHDPCRELAPARFRDPTR
jgi:hypothetical protein